MGYWNIVEPVWDAINIYDTPEIFSQTSASPPSIMVDVPGSYNGGKFSWTGVTFSKAL